MSRRARRRFTFPQYAGIHAPIADYIGKGHGPVPGNSCHGAAGNRSEYERELMFRRWSRRVDQHVRVWRACGLYWKFQREE